jgi:hypothetical protein
VSGERQHIGRLIKTAILSVVLLHHLVGDQHNGKPALFNTKFGCQYRKKAANTTVIDRMLSLLIYKETLASRVAAVNSGCRLLVQSEAIVAAPCFARNMSHRLGRSVEPADDGQRLAR